MKFSNPYFRTNRSLTVSVFVCCHKSQSFLALYYNTSYTEKVVTLLQG